MTSVCPKCGGEVFGEGAEAICDGCGYTLGNEGGGNEGGELSEEQLKAFSKGEAIEFAGANADDFSAMDDLTIAKLIESESAVPADSDSDNNDDDNDDNNQDDIILQKGVKQVGDSPIKRLLKKILGVVIILAIGFGLGFLFNIIWERGILDIALNDIGYKAVGVIDEQFKHSDGNEKLIALDIYAKQDTGVTECIVFGVLYEDINNYHPTYYRILFNNNDEADVKVFAAFDREEHNALRQGDERERLRADMMMNNYESFLRSVNEIISGDERWVSPSTEHINMRLLKDSYPNLLEKLLSLVDKDNDENDDDDEQEPEIEVEPEVEAED